MPCSDVVGYQSFASSWIWRQQGLPNVAIPPYHYTASHPRRQETWIFIAVKGKFSHVTGMFRLWNCVWTGTVDWLRAGRPRFDFQKWRVLFPLPWSSDRFLEPSNGYRSKSTGTWSWLLISISADIECVCVCMELYFNAPNAPSWCGDYEQGDLCLPGEWFILSKEMQWFQINE
jgi:hypothetical protein